MSDPQPKLYRLNHGLGVKEQIQAISAFANKLENLANSSKS